MASRRCRYICQRLSLCRIGLDWRTPNRIQQDQPEVVGLRASFGERPPGLIQHVQTVRVLGSWVLLLPRLPPSSESRSLRLLPWASILLHGPLDICLALLLAAPYHLCETGTHSTCFYSTGEHTPKVGKTLRYGTPIRYAMDTPPSLRPRPPARKGLLLEIGETAR